MAERKRIVVVGAGVGGLTAAARLAHAGFNVTVLEKNATVGGRLDRVRRGGYTWDTGPTLLLMTDVYREFFRSLGRDLSDYLALHRLEPNYRIRFGDGATLDMTGNLPRLIENVETIEPGAGRGLLRFLADAGEKYRLGRRGFVERGFESASEFFSPVSLLKLARSGAVANYWRHTGHYFRDERLRQAFSFQTIYLGISPYHAPAIYTLLPYAELVEDGLWFPEGGMYALAEAICRAAEQEGAQIRTGVEVRGICTRGGRVRGVETATGEVTADVVLANADLPYVYRHLIADSELRDVSARKVDALDYTCSAYMLYIGARRRWPHLLHHDFFLSVDYKGTLDDIFERRALPRDPAFYLCAASESEPSYAPEGGTSLMALVPVPAQSRTVDWQRDGAAFRARILALLESRAGLDGLRDATEVCWERTPADWQSAYNLHKGAAFGLAHGLFQVGWFRPDNRSRRLPNLYFVGASTRPGTGVPLVMIGARLVAERIVREQIP
jgi:phytoene desaturase